MSFYFTGVGEYFRH